VTLALQHPSAPSPGCSESAGTEPIVFLINGNGLLFEVFGPIRKGAKIYMQHRVNLRFKRSDLVDACCVREADAQAFLMGFFESNFMLYTIRDAKHKNMGERDPLPARV
jgi:hypothetical protein